MKWSSHSLFSYIDEVLEFVDWDKDPKDMLHDLAIAIIHEFELGDIKFDVTSFRIILYDVPNPFGSKPIPHGWHWLSEKALYQTCFKSCHTFWRNGYDYSTGSSVNINNAGETRHLTIIFDTVSLARLEHMKK